MKKIYDIKTGFLTTFYFLRNYFQNKGTQIFFKADRDAPLISYVLISLLCFVMYVYLSTNFLPTFYYASTDWISLSDHLLNPGQWSMPINENNTAQLRTIGYPIYLIITTLGSLDPQIINTTNYILVYISVITSFIISSRLIHYKLALVISCLYILSFAPFAFATTILSEHLIISLLAVLSPLIVLSVFKPSLKSRFGVILFLVFLCLIKTLFFPILLLYGFYLLADWKISGSSLSNKEYSFPLLFASFAFIFALNSNSLFVKNYNSGTFIFGIMNTIMYGGDASSDDINEIYRPLIDEDIFDEAKARDTLRRVDIKAKRVLDRNKMTYDDVLEEIFTSPTLETYWQIKWVLLNKLPSEQMANDLARSLYIGYVKRYPLQFISHTFTSFKKFILAKASHFKYSINPENLLREEGGLKIYRTNKITSDKLAPFFKKHDIKINNEISTKRALKLKVKENVIIKKTTEWVFLFNFIALIIWILISIICLIKLSRNKLIYKKDLWQNLMVSSFFLQASFMGSALGSVLFHPSLGRYILPFLPLVLTSCIVTSCSIRLSLKKLFETNEALSFK